MKLLFKMIVAVSAVCFSIAMIEIAVFGYLYFVPARWSPAKNLLNVMIHNFHPLFHRDADNQTYYPFIGLYHEGHWGKTPPSDGRFPDGWVLPYDEGAPGPQKYFKPEKEPGVIRVVTLGGSTMIGWGQSSWEHSIPMVLQSDLSAKISGKRIEVIPGAFPSLISSQELTALATKLIAYHPDVIVVVDGFNDFSRTIQYPDIPPFWGTHQEYFYRNYARTQTIRGCVAQILYLLSKKFYTLALLRAVQHGHKMDNSHIAGEGKWPHVLERAISEYLMTHISMKGIAQAHRIPIVLAFQPSLFHRKTITEQERQTLLSSPYHEVFAQGADFYFPVVDQDYSALAKNENSPGTYFLNFSGLFEKKNETLYVDACHYNDVGADLIAKALEPTIIAALSVKR